MIRFLFRTVFWLGIVVLLLLQGIIVRAIIE